MKEFLQNYKNHLLFAGLFLGAFLLKYPYLEMRDLAMDEPFTLFHSQKSFLDILALPGQKEPHPPLFMLLMHLWNKVANYDVETLRLMPLFFHALTAPILFFTGKRFFGVWAGILTVSLFLLSNTFFYYSQELRAYGLFCLLSASALYLFLSQTEKPERKNLVLLCITNILLAYTHYFGWFIIGMEGLCALFYFKNRKLFLQFLTVIGVTLLAFTPMIGVLIDQFSHSSGGTWINPPVPEDYKIELRSLLNNKSVFRSVKWILIIGALISFLLQRFFKTKKKYWAVLIWWVIPFTFMFFISEKIPMFIDRYLLFNAIGIYVFIGAALQRLAHFKWLQAILAIFLVYNMYDNSNTYEHYCKRELKQAVEFVKNNQSSTDLVGVYPPWVKLNFGFHYDLDSFKQVNQMDAALLEHNVIISWGAREYFKRADDIGSEKIILFTNNGFSADNELISKLQNEFPNKQTHTFKQNVQVVILTK